MSERSASGRMLQVVFLTLGIILLGAVLWQSDLRAMTRYVGAAGWGILAIFSVYLVAFLADTLSWQLVIPNGRRGLAWFYRLWKVRMVGAAVNRVTPIIGMAGEPLKAILLRRYYGVGYQDGAASLVAAKTANLMALVAFLAIGFVLAMIIGGLPTGFAWGALGALSILAVGVLALIAVEYMKLSSRVGSWLATRSFGRPIARVIENVRILDELLVKNFTSHRREFATAILLTFANWICGALELWLTFWIIGHPISFVEAWYIDAAVELVRAATFFIPAGIGTQEAALVFVVGSLGGQSSLGLAIAVIRRFRELVWVFWGFLIGWYSFNRREAQHSRRKICR